MAKIINAVDCHVHLREGQMLDLVAPYTAKYFKTAIVMPNLLIPIKSLEGVYKYKQRIAPYFDPLMTLYFDVNYDRELLTLAKEYIATIKMYPKGATTNSQYGIDLENSSDVYRVLALMEELEIPLSVHAEAPGYHQDREMNCIKYLTQWIDDFPDLRIVIEHVGDERVLHLLNYKNVYATITPHHLFLTGDDYVGPPLNVHNYCLPVCKRREDQRGLYAAVVHDYKNKVMLGTDSAPHYLRDKHTYGCAGIFNSPIALLVVAQVFDNDQEIMQRFCSDNAKCLHKLNFNDDKVVEIIKKSTYVPHRYGPDLIPMWARKELAYSYDE